MKENQRVLSMIVDPIRAAGQKILNVIAVKAVKWYITMEGIYKNE